VAVQEYLQLMPELQTSNRSQRRLQELHLDHVFAVDGKRVMDAQPATGAERESFGVAGLRSVAPGAVGDGRRPDCDVPDGQSADLAGRGQIVLEQRRRYAKDVSVVVEPAARIVGRQERRRIDVESEDVANRVRILGAIEPVQRGTTWIGF